MDTTRNAPPAELARVQGAFTAHLRDATAPCPTDVPPRRAAAYRELLFNNVEGMIAACFPITREILGEDRWQALVRDFFSGHRSHSPYFRDIPREFLRYLNTERPPLPGEPPFLRELMHYEWVELALGVDGADLAAIAVTPGTGLLAGVPVVNPLAWALAYRFPVHRIGPGFQPLVPEPERVHLIVCRQRTHDIRFLEVNALTARLFHLLSPQARCGQAVLTGLAAELGHPDPETILQTGGDILEDFARRDILLGANPHATEPC